MRGQFVVRFERCLRALSSSNANHGVVADLLGLARAWVEIRGWEGGSLPPRWRTGFWAAKGRLQQLESREDLSSTARTLCSAIDPEAPWSPDQRLGLAKAAAVLAEKYLNNLRKGA